MSCVYKLTFPSGGVYIGKTDRKLDDRMLNGWGYRGIPVLFNAIVKYGWDNVKKEIIVDDLTHEQACKRELLEIAKHSASDIIYNEVGIPAQIIAQETAHYISPNDTCTDPSTENKRIKKKNIKKRKSAKSYIIPIIPKATNNHVCPIDVYDTTGKFLCTYPSAKIASKELNINHGDIVSCCKGVKADGKRKYQAKGYIFRYHDVLKDLQF